MPALTASPGRWAKLIEAVKKLKNMEIKLNPARHLYGRGWLGLIPLVGGFVGIGLILLGIIKYRDKKLILIGIAALSFTVIAYSSLIYYFSYSEKARKDFSVFTQPQMNNLIKNIEFYKVEYGTYPENLNQLAKEDKFVQINDPMPQGQKINHSEFYYKKLNQKYYLFSSGVDNIPFTSDDIYPSLKFYDSTKTGLIRPVK
jgi:hypothetical protein